MVNHSHRRIIAAGIVFCGLLLCLSFPVAAQTTFSVPLFSLEGREFVSLGDIASKLGIPLEKTPGVGLFSFSLGGKENRLGDAVPRVLVGEDWLFLSTAPRGFGEDLWLIREDMELLLRTGLAESEPRFSQVRGEEGPEWVVVLQDTAFPLAEEETPTRVDLPPPEPLLRPNVDSDFTIIIDAGHGGDDPGVVSERSWTEKQVTLDVAMALRRILLDRLLCQVKLTRKGDYAVSLEHRVAFANQGKQGACADILISLHANAAFDSQITGFACYVATPVSTESLSPEDTPLAGTVFIPGQGSWDSDSLNELSRELYALTFPEIPSNVSGTDMFRLELLQNPHIERSDRLRKAIVSSVQARTQVRVLNIGAGPLRILRSVSMPAVLIELGFLTNPLEAQNLVSGDYQTRLAEAIAEGIISFLPKATP